MMEEQKFQELLYKKRQETEKILLKYIPEETGFQKTVIEAMNYSLMSGGKRLRSMLMRETYFLFGGKGAVIEPFMTAIEMIHSYSLVHDDLPAMDNDEYRRGRKTTHIVYGEAMGILAGDGLLNYAYETALSALAVKDEAPVCENTEFMQAVSRALRILAGKSGIYGMIGGQTADVESEDAKEPISEDKLLYIHGNKTSALIQAAMMVGAVLAGAGAADVDKISECAYKIGMAFQIRDDILDVTGSSAELGKKVGSDEKNHKQTYVTIYGLEPSKKAVEKFTNEASGWLEEFGGESDFLCELIRSLAYRSK